MEQEKSRFKAASRMFVLDKGKNRIVLTWVSEEYGYLRGKTGILVRVLQRHSQKGYACVHAHTHAHTLTHTHAHTDARTHRQTHTCTHSYTHTHTELS